MLKILFKSSFREKQKEASCRDFYVLVKKRHM